MYALQYGLRLGSAVALVGAIAAVALIGRRPSTAQEQTDTAPVLQPGAPPLQPDAPALQPEAPAVTAERIGGGREEIPAPAAERVPA